MRILMGALGVMLLVPAVLFISHPVQSFVFASAGIITIVGCWPMKSKVLLGALGFCAAVLMFLMFAGFFGGVAAAHTDSNWYELEEAGLYFAFLFGGFVMMLAVSEYSCWMKGRKESFKISLPNGVKETGRRFGKMEFSD